MGLTVALIGCGSIAPTHLDALVRNDHVDRVFAADPSEEAREAMFSRYGIIKRLAEDWRELIADDEVDVVDILTPHDSHRDIAVAALEAGRDVICEKPIARTVAEADEMITAAERTGHRLFVAMSQLNFPAVIAARELIAEGAIGRPLLALFTVLDNEVERMNDPEHWKCDLERAGGGAFIDLGYHTVYIMQDLLGPAEAVTATGSRLLVEPETKGEDTAAVALELAGGSLGSIVVTFADAATRYQAERRIIGTEGTLLIRDQPEDEWPLLLIQDEATSPVRVHATLDEQGYAVQATLDDFVAALVSGDEPPISTEAARQALVTVEAAYESMRTGCRVEIPRGESTD